LYIVIDFEIVSKFFVTISNVSKINGTSLNLTDDDQIKSLLYI